jgi:hypothetical protein
VLCNKQDNINPREGVTEAHITAEKQCGIHLKTMDKHLRKAVTLRRKANLLLACRALPGNE